MRWLAYALASTAMSMLAIGVPSSSPVDVAPATVPVAFVMATQLPVAEPDVEVPDEVAAPDFPAPEVPVPDAPAEPPPPPPPSNPCADALTSVAEVGLPLPAGVDYHCPSTQFAHQGAACWGNSTFCPDRGFIAINMDLLNGTSTEYLRHVVAHEVCHILDFQTTGRTTEWGADACADAHLART